MFFICHLFLLFPLKCVFSCSISVKIPCWFPFNYFSSLSLEPDIYMEAVMSGSRPCSRLNFNKIFTRLAVGMSLLSLLFPQPVAQNQWCYSQSSGTLLYSASLDDTLREPDLTYIFSGSKEAQESFKHLSEHLPRPKSGLLVCFMGWTVAPQNLYNKVLTPSTPECDCIDKELIIVKKKKKSKPKKKK